MKTNVHNLGTGTAVLAGHSTSSCKNPLADKIHLALGRDSDNLAPDNASPLTDVLEILRFPDSKLQKRKRPTPSWLPTLGSVPAKGARYFLPCSYSVIDRHCPREP
jgi:hypothetical protein